MDCSSARYRILTCRVTLSEPLSKPATRLPPSGSCCCDSAGRLFEVGDVANPPVLPAARRQPAQNIQDALLFGDVPVHLLVHVWWQGHHGAPIRRCLRRRVASRHVDLCLVPHHDLFHARRGRLRQLGIVYGMRVAVRFGYGLGSGRARHLDASHRVLDQVPDHLLIRPWIIRILTFLIDGIVREMRTLGDQRVNRGLDHVEPVDQIGDVGTVADRRRRQCLRRERPAGAGRPHHQRAAEKKVPRATKTPGHEWHLRLYEPVEP